LFAFILYYAVEGYKINADKDIALVKKQFDKESENRNQVTR